MNTYIVTCRQPNGEVVEQRVKARNHHEAQRMFEEAGMGEVVILDRETRADHVVNRRVRGIGADLIGPYDLSASMGKVGQWAAPEVAAAYDESCRKTRAAGVLLGVYAECMFDVWKRHGVQFMAIKNDTNAMLLGYQEMMRRARG